MVLLSLSEVLTSLVTSVVGTLGNLLCSPFCGKIKTCTDVATADDEVLREDVDELRSVEKKIRESGHSTDKKNWLSEVANTKERVHPVLSSSNQQPSCCKFSHGLKRCRLHKKVRELKEQGKNLVTCDGLERRPGENIPGVPNIEAVDTAANNLNQVVDLLNNDEVWIIGVWGPGGVGKTTFVKALNNKLQSTSSFTLVKFIELTQEANESQLQEAIARSLDLEGTNTSEIANRIYNKLQWEKFLLILDNVWKYCNLASIGIPENQEGSKVIITTRDNDVCNMMNARPFKIECLTPTNAWQLFVEKAGDVVNNVEIQQIAEAVCGECGGLPLALVAVGSAMRGKTNIRLWQSARNDLERSIFPCGVESQVYKPLKLSYDFLAKDDLKASFLYCSLYPQGYNNNISELVKCWWAENIIDERLTYQSAYCKGLELIEKLKSSCLLEEGDSEGTVKMHDVVRDVAIQIGNSNGTLFVFSGREISKKSTIELPEEVEKVKWISFLGNEYIELPRYKKALPNVTTILVCKTKGHVRVSEEFLQGFPAVRVLNVYELLLFPPSLLHLNELRALLLRPCIQVFHGFVVFSIEELPDEAKLMVIDLADLGLCKLPQGVEKQTNLMVLNWRHNPLKTIDVDVISKLSALTILNMLWSGYKWPTKRKDKSKEVTLQDLSGLESLKEVYLVLADAEATYSECNWMERLENFFFIYRGHVGREHDGKDIIIVHAEESKIGSWILHANYLVLEDMNAKEIFANFNSTDLSNSILKSLDLQGCRFSEELSRPVPTCSSFSNLESLRLDRNDGIRSFIAHTVGIIFPQLRSLEICQYFDMTEVFHGDPAETQAVVPKLRRLVLSQLDSLQGLSNFHSSELWQSLEVLEVLYCDKLKKLPCMASIKEIVGSGKWWNNLEWDSLETKQEMGQFFKGYDIINEESDEDLPLCNQPLVDQHSFPLQSDQYLPASSC